MKLKQYIRKHGGTGRPSCEVLAGLAKRVRIRKDTLYAYMRGTKKMGPKLAVRVETATNMEVTRNELRPDLFGRLKTKKAA